MASSSSSSLSAQGQPARRPRTEGLANLHDGNEPPTVRSSGVPDEHSQGSRTFTLFPRLPPELRTLIWVAAREPRACIALICSSCRLEDTFSPHALLSVCRESRHAALLHRQREQPLPSPFPWYFYSNERCHFDAALDVLVLKP
ncbi:hypothetical protein F4775DRAFT_483404 [Biscogniauxia sp. FL1348]|nr:hypothetical protein F4775DRAFT_483404 [Biscogniauxia sp. FL1348]